VYKVSKLCDAATLGSNMRDLECAAFCALRFKAFVDFAAICDNWLAKVDAIVNVVKSSEKKRQGVEDSLFDQDFFSVALTTTSARLDFQPCHHVLIPKSFILLICTFALLEKRGRSKKRPESTLNAMNNS
jgi:hypothetical protein